MSPKPGVRRGATAGKQTNVIKSAGADEDQLEERIHGVSERPLAYYSLVAEGSAIDVEQVANAFGISKSQLAETIGIPRESFYKRARSEAPKTQTRLREMLEIVSRVSDWAGGKERAMAWYRAQPLSAFGGRTPESLAKSGDAAALRDYLDHIALGGYA